VKLCINCLKIGHYAKECKSSNCRKCAKVHNTLLHLDPTDTRVESSASGDTQSLKEEKKSTTTQCNIVSCQSSVCESKQSNISLANSSKSSSTKLILLATAQVYVQDNKGVRHTCRVLLDPGSQSHLVTEELALKLQLPRRQENRVINGVMQCTTDVRHSISLDIESHCTNFKTKLDCLVLPTITERLPQVQISKGTIVLPEDARIADPLFDKPGKIDVLIGAGLFWNLLCVGQIKGGHGKPTWQKTLLGWVGLEEKL